MCFALAFVHPQVPFVISIVENRGETFSAVFFLLLVWDFEEIFSPIAIDYGALLDVEEIFLFCRIREIENLHSDAFGPRIPNMTPKCFVDLT